MPQALEPIAAKLTDIATGIDTRQSNSGLSELFTQARVLCQAAADYEQSAPLKQSLANVAVALQTWHEVWPRLGVQQEFRLAVCREARLWAKRLLDIGRRGCT